MEQPNIREGPDRPYAKTYVETYTQTYVQSFAQSNSHMTNPMINHIINLTPNPLGQTLNQFMRKVRANTLMKIGVNLGMCGKHIDQMHNTKNRNKIIDGSASHAPRDPPGLRGSPPYMASLPRVFFSLFAFALHCIIDQIIKIYMHIMQCYLWQIVYYKLYMHQPLNLYATMHHGRTDDTFIYTCKGSSPSDKAQLAHSLHQASSTKGKQTSI